MRVQLRSHSIEVDLLIRVDFHAALLAEAAPLILGSVCAADRVMHLEDGLSVLVAAAVGHVEECFVVRRIVRFQIT